MNNGETGSITFIGTVSPAGGNLKEPVTENTKKVARCFYALEQDRADKKRYPAVNPIDSYSKYIEYPEFEDYIGQCKFTSCSHTCEKGCAILQMVEGGKIQKSRHNSYVDMYNEIKDIKEWEIRK